MRSVVAISATGAGVLVAATASARGYGAIGGTTATKSYANWSEFNAGGVKNTAPNARDWLMPIDLTGEYCEGPNPCIVNATFRGGSGGASCVRAYRLNVFGQVTASIGPVCQQGTTLARRQIGTVSTPTNTGTLLVVANLAGGASTPGAMTSVELTGNFQLDLTTAIGAIRGSSTNFDTSNWGEFGIGGIRNRSTSQRWWVISVPNPRTGKGPDRGVAGAVYGGGATGQSCVTAWGVDAFGALLLPSGEFCRTSLGWRNLGKLPGVHVVYYAELAGASTMGGNDGGMLASVQY
jgi:hypothetical protein